jgi:hypothetical protein
VKNRIVGERWLRPRVEEAETLDYEFALQMQGLQNSTLSHVWTTLDPSGSQQERVSMMREFLAGYLERFLQQQRVGDLPSTDSVIGEALRMHDKFCAQWLVKHKRCLSPVIEAACTAIVSLFLQASPCMQRWVPRVLTPREMGMFLRRDKILSPHFALCLHFHMVKLEQDRGTRNANYKSMNNAFNANVLSLNSMAKLLQQHQAYIHSTLTSEFDLNDESKWFSPLIVDWFSIANQLVTPDHQFKYYRPVAPLFPARAGDRHRSGDVLDVV